MRASGQGGQTCSWNRNAIAAAQRCAGASGPRLKALSMSAFQRPGTVPINLKGEPANYAPRNTKANKRDLRKMHFHSRNQVIYMIVPHFLWHEAMPIDTPHFAFPLGGGASCAPREVIDCSHVPRAIGPAGVRDEADVHARQDMRVDHHLTPDPQRNMGASTWPKDRIRQL